MHRVMAATLVGGLLIFTGVVHPGTAAARASAAQMPEAPAPGYTPRFVTQTDEPSPWEDCLWASGSMLLDKWTHGGIRIDRFRLRRASGDAKAGSHFSDLARAVGRLYGWRPRWSPNGGDAMTWAGLLRRLGSGGGAIVAGDYGELGSPFTRWDRSYAAARNAPGHAMYVERYDAARGRMWLMDPLGRGGYRGEWVPARRIRSFIWHRGGLVYALATPAPPEVSMTGYLPGGLRVAAGTYRGGEAVAVSLPIVRSGPWSLPNLLLAADWQLVAPDVHSTTATVEDAENVPAEGARTPLMLGAGPTLVGTLALPAQPGLWQLSPSLERDDGRSMPEAWRLEPILVRIWGDRGALVAPRLAADVSLAASQPLALTVNVENAGRAAWTTDSDSPDVGEDAVEQTPVLTVSWLAEDGSVRSTAPAITLTGASGETLTPAVNLTAPPLPGTYWLHVDVSDGAGSLQAPEAQLEDIQVVVGPAPVATAVPVQSW